MEKFVFLRSELAFELSPGQLTVESISVCAAISVESISVFAAN